MGGGVEAGQNCRALADMHLEGQNDVYFEQVVEGGLITFDYSTRFALLERGCKLGDAVSCIGALESPGRYDEISDMALASLAEIGCALEHQPRSGESCGKLGEFLEMGTNGAPDIDAAYALYEKGCLRGAAAPCNKVVELALSPDPKYLDRAVDLAKLGCASSTSMDAAYSCYLLGMAFEGGLAGPKHPKDLGVAFEYYKQACFYTPQIGCDSAAKLKLLEKDTYALTDARFFAQINCEQGSCAQLRLIYSEYGSGSDSVETVSHYLQRIVQQMEEFEPESAFGKLTMQKEFYREVIRKMQKDLNLLVTGRFGVEEYEKIRSQIVFAMNP